MQTTQPSSAWQEYDAAKKPKPIVPEASAYGAILIAVLLLAIGIKRFRQR